MTIKAILRDGRIQPLEPLPRDWAEGQELVVEEPELVEAETQINQWTKDLDKSTAQIPAEEHDRFLRALDEIERASKGAVRREWSVS
jgi:hypothetical protein